MWQLQRTAPVHAQLRVRATSALAAGASSAVLQLLCCDGHAAAPRPPWLPLLRPRPHPPQVICALLGRGRSPRRPQPCPAPCRWPCQPTCALLGGRRRPHQAHHCPAALKWERPPLPRPWAPPLTYALLGYPRRLHHCPAGLGQERWMKVIRLQPSRGTAPLRQRRTAPGSPSRPGCTRARLPR